MSSEGILDKRLEKVFPNLDDPRSIKVAVNDVNMNGLDDDVEDDDNDDDDNNNDTNDDDRTSANDVNNLKV